MRGIQELRRDGTGYCRRLILLISEGWVPPYWGPSGAGLGLGTRVDRSRLLTLSRATPISVVPARLSSWWCYARAGMARAMAHMKAISSRAIAVTATLGCFPRATRRR